MKNSAALCLLPELFLGFYRSITGKRRKGYSSKGTSQSSFLRQRKDGVSDMRCSLGTAQFVRGRLRPDSGGGKASLQGSGIRRVDLALTCDFFWRLGRAGRVYDAAAQGHFLSSRRFLQNSCAEISDRTVGKSL
jgi:hypothetical protein